MVAPVSLDLNLTYEGRAVRCVGTDERPQWVAADLCANLGLKNVSQALSTVPESEKGITISDTLGGKQTLVTVYEAGLYRLLLKSRKPEAEKFKTWLCNEVLPSIRKYGTYPAPQNATDAASVPADLIERLIGRVEHMQQQIDRLHAAPAILPMIAPAVPRYTVRTRLKWRCLHFPKAARRKVQRRAAEYVEKHSDEAVMQAGGEGGGGPTWFQGGQITLLDQAIDEVLAELDRKRRDEELRQPTIPFAVNGV